MNNFGKHVLALAALLTLPTAAFAAPQNPELAAHVGEGDDPAEKSKALAISKLDLDVEIAADTARTTLTASFANSGDQALEGNFVFDLPPGSVVTGYGLDVDDKMVDGVLAAKRQAKLVYEQRVRRGVDPGLAEVTRSGAFMTRIFPIFPGKGRTIKLSFVTPLEPDRAFAIPLATETEVGEARIHVHLGGIGTAPSISGPKGIDLSWRRGADGFDADDHFKTRKLSGALSIGAMAPRPVTLLRHSNGDAFFEIDDVVAPEAARPEPDNMRLYWDSSRSRRDRDLTSEIALAASYVDAVHPKSIDIVAFADKLTNVRTLSSPTGAQVKEVLEKIDYRGATSMAPLLQVATNDFCLLFSDGNMTVDAHAPAEIGCPLFAVSGAADADRGFLTALARRNGGAFVDLRVQDAATALAMLTSRTPRVMTVSDGAGNPIPFATLPANGNRVRIIGPLPQSGHVGVAFSPAAARSYSLDRSTIVPGDALGAFWASARDSELGATDRPDRDAMLALERRYSVAGAASDFIVLESLDDYIQAEIEPPASLGHDAVNQYRLLAKANAANKAAAEEDRLKKVVGLWDEQKAWWRTDFEKLAEQKPKVTKTGERIETAVIAGGHAPPAQVSLPPPPPPPPPPASQAQGGSDSSVETVVTTGSRAPQDSVYAASPVTAVGNDEARPSGSVIETTMADWNPDRPYIKAFDAAGADKLDETYREQEKEHGNAPAFYLDAGEYYFRHGRAKDAASIALNAVELPQAGPETLTILADRLMRYGQIDRALWCYDRLVFLEGDRPQPKRNLALALIAGAEHGDSAEAKRADYQRALQLLSDVIMHDWDGKYDGVEVIALMEANRIIAKLKAMGAKDLTLDPRLIALLDVDLRVVLEWNTDETDMDLWVDEPSGERAIYNHPKTTIGGRLSNDMTNGYGPEEYLLHKAPSGAYTVRVNVYRSDRINPNGATTVRAHIFRNYGRADEDQQDLELELKRGTDGNELVGVVTVARKKR